MSSTQTSTTKSARKAVSTSTKKSSAKAGSSKTRAKAGAKRGPRGFSVSSPAWTASIKSQAGIALKPANFPKLVATAKALGVKSTSTKPETLVAAVARALH